jgi:diacylglycerol O-acyltransferase / wax synthase
VPLGLRLEDFRPCRIAGSVTDSVLMEHLTTLDATFIEAEDSDRHVSLAIGAVAVLDGPIPEDDELVAGLADRVSAVPRLRQVLRRHPLDLGTPEWVDDPNVDLAHHVHRVALPHPGDESVLFRMVADLMERRLDRDRPLWECWIIEGLADGRWAMLTKIHHCIADGIATTHLLAQLSDDAGSDTYATEIRAAHEPSGGGLRLPEISLNPLNWVTGAWRASSAVAVSAVRVWEGAVDILGELLRPAATSSLIGPVTAMRRYVSVQVPLEDVATVCHSFDVTLNDVALAAITNSFRASLIRRGEQPRRDSIRTLVPVSVRSNNDAAKTDNRVSAMFPCLPVEQADPVAQLRSVHKRLTKAKGSGQRQAGSAFVFAIDAMPFAVTGRVLRGLTRLPQRGVVTVATNVPGPRHQMKVMGRNVVRMLPVPPIALQLRTAVAILSYADQLVFGITADYDTVPDVDVFAADIVSTIERLVNATGQRGYSKTKRLG